MEKYIVNGKINSRYIAEKEFSSPDQALAYIDRLCTRYDLQVEDIINEKFEDTYVVDYYNQFSVKMLRA